MKIIAGLGNPGKKYAHTKHNMGFLLLDAYAKKHRFTIDRKRFKSLCYEGRFFGEKILFIKPQTYMNLSGNAVAAAMNYYSLPIEDLFVIYDDVDLPLGALRIRKSGSAGTHNGMRDIIKALGSGDFPRLRLGIGRNEHIPIVNEVLSGFTSQEKKTLELVFSQGIEAINSFLKDGVDLTMSRYNGMVHE